MGRLQTIQTAICQKYKVAPFPSPKDAKVGISLNVREGLVPIHGMRLRPAGDTCGWYLWAGEYSSADDFFHPLHVRHLDAWCPSVLPYLQLPPGWRFLVTPDYEDVWYDSDVPQ